MGVAGNCKDCQKKYNKEHYILSKGKWVNARAAARKEVRQRNQAVILEWLSSHPCVDCGNDDIRVLEFDHLPEHKKLNNVSNLINNSTEVLVAEIAKCEVRCANCHKIKTYERIGGSYRTKAFIDIVN